MGRNTMGNEGRKFREIKAVDGLEGQNMVCVGRGAVATTSREHMERRKKGYKMNGKS